MKFGIVLSLILMFAMPVFAEEASVETSQAPAATEQVTATSEAQIPLAVEKPKSEDQIPVHFNQIKKSESPAAANGRLFMTFGILTVVLGLGYYLAKRYGRPRNSPKTNIKVLTQHYLGPKKSLAIVRVAGESILIGVTDNNISMLKSLSLLDDEIPETFTNSSFGETLNEKKEISREPAGAGPMASSDNSEEFSIRHIKDVVSLKLKGMRRDL